jgi:exo-beta-1,3-glucanase (GH17 family)
MVLSMSTGFSENAVGEPLASVGGGGIIGVCFGPWPNTGPNTGPTQGWTATPEWLNTCFSSIEGSMEWMTTYNVGGPVHPGMDKASEVARKHNLKTAPCAWIYWDPNDLAKSKQDNDQQVATLKSLIGQGVVDYAIIGNEPFAQRGAEPNPYPMDQAADDLVAYINDVKQAAQGTKVKVGTRLTAGVGNDQYHKQVVEASEIVQVTIHPADAGVSIDDAKSYLNNGYQVSRKQMVSWFGEKFGGRELQVGETGWPSAGNANNQAEFTVPNAKRYYGEVQDWAHTNGVKVFYFEFCDEPWKSNYDMNKFDSNWGLWHWDDGQKKFVAKFNVKESRFYFAEGYTGDNFQEYLCVGNANDSGVTLEASYLFTDGSTRDETYLIPANSRCTVDVNSTVGEGKEVSVCMRSEAENLVVERLLYFSYKNKWSGGSVAVGGNSAHRRWYFAEGTTRSNFDEYVTVLNPYSTEANLTFRYMIEGEGESTHSETVGARSRATFIPRNHLGEGKDISLFVESDQDVVVERSMYFDYQGLSSHGWKGGHCVVGTNSPAREWYFAEGTTRSGFEEWLCMQNTNDEQITVDAVYMPEASQGEPIQKSYPVPANQRLTVSVTSTMWAKKRRTVSGTGTVDTMFSGPMNPLPPGSSRKDTPGSSLKSGSASRTPAQRRPP